MWRAATPDVLRHVALDSMTAIFDRRSGQTHVVAAVVPELLAATGPEAVDVSVIAARLGIDSADAALGDRLDELAAVGLVERL